MMNEIIAYENGELSPMEIVHLFAELVRTELAWELQGHYGRAACSLIDRGLITIDGQVNLNSCEAAGLFDEG
jgi:hypothetical protein